MGKAKTYHCEQCDTLYPTKLVKCPQCGYVNERRISQVCALEIKAAHNPANGLLCKKCGTIFPNDITKCPYCANPSANAKPLSSLNGTLTIETPTTRLLKNGGYTVRIKANDSRHKNQVAQLVRCDACKKEISSKAETCPHCGNPTGVHVCPKCGGINTKTISGASKVTSVFLWGRFAANKVISKFQCKDCGHKW